MFGCYDCISFLLFCFCKAVILIEKLICADSCSRAKNSFCIGGWGSRRNDEIVWIFEWIVKNMRVVDSNVDLWARFFVDVNFIDF